MLTVLLTTSDGRRALAEVLEAYGRLTAPAGGWRLLVVEDGCPPATQARIRAEEGRLPLTVVAGPARGLNRARNEVASEIRGDLLVLTDDDAVPDPGWLVAYREAADRHPEASVFAGTVRPRFPGPVPDAVRAVRWGPTFGAVERPESGPVDPKEAVGANLAVRVSALPPGPLFHEGIGPDGSAEFAMGAETELLQRLGERGARGYYVREAAIEHVLPDDCLTDAWILARTVRFGRGCRRLGLKSHRGDAVTLAGLGLGLWADLVGRRVALTRARRAGDASRALHARWRLAMLAGEALEARRGPRGEGRPLPWLARALLPRDVRGHAARHEDAPPIRGGAPSPLEATRP